MRTEHIMTAIRNTITNELLTRRDVANLFRCSIMSIIRLEAAGKLPAVRISAGSVRYRRTDVQSYIESCITK
jgi:excisionase family DNA binding protein